MHKYLVQIGDESSNHFRKYDHFSEVNSWIKKDNMDTSKDVTDMSFHSNDDEAIQAYRTSSSHVYRIKDITDAINTSVIIGGKQREEYIQMLSDSNSDLSVDRNFISICRNVGECDTM